MLQMRKEQMAEFEKAMRQKFEDRMVAHIAKDFPEQYREMRHAKGSDAPVRQFVWDGVKRAEGYGITSESNVELFLDLLLDLGTDFDTRADTDWTREVLDAPDLPEDEKMDTIYGELDRRGYGEDGAAAWGYRR